MLIDKIIWLNLLDKTIEKFTNEPETWTSLAFARDINGNNCSPHSSNAVSFCALGYMRTLDTYNTNQLSHYVIDHPFLTRISIINDDAYSAKNVVQRLKIF